MTNVPENIPESTHDIQSVAEAIRPWHGEKRRKRRYWSNQNPEDFAFYPEFEKLSYFNEMTLIRKAQAGDLHARNELWERNLRLVYTIINNFNVSPDMMADALQEGAIGIKRAIEKFELDRYGAFSTYAWTWIWQRIQIFVQRRTRLCRIPANLTQHYARFRRDMLQAYTEAEAFDVIASWKEQEPHIVSRLVGIHRISTPLGLHLLPEECHPVYEDRWAEEDIDRHALISDAVAQLRDREKTIIVRRFGLDGDPEETLEELGSRFQVTRERVRQIEASGLQKIGRFLSLRTSEASAEQPLSLRRPNDEDAFMAEMFLSTVGDSVYTSALSDDMLMEILGWLSFSQSNAIINFFGLLKTPRASLHEIAELLELTAEQTRYVLHTGVRNLLSELKHFQHETVQNFAGWLQSEAYRTNIR